MRNEIEEKDLEIISGGVYHINVNLNRVAFESTGKVYQLVNCSPYEAQAAMDELSGKYPTEAVFDAECVKMLQKKGWI